MIQKASIFFFVFFYMLTLTAQQGPSVTVTVDRHSILIGEPLMLKVDVFIPPGQSFRSVFPDSIAHFELLELPVVDTLQVDGGSRINGIYKLTSFDSGRWVIPSFAYSKNIFSDTLVIDVGYSPFDPNKPYHDIKDILEVTGPEKKKQWWWYAAAAGLLLIIALIFLLRRKKSTYAPQNIPTADPYLAAMRELETLSAQRLPAKEFYERLINIFRVYVFRKKGLLSLQKTTDDLVIQLKEISIDKNKFDRLAQALRLSDFVKFAKYAPSDDDNRTAFADIREAITVIEKTESPVHKVS